MLTKHKNILFALIGIILIFFGYWYFVLSKKDDTSTTDSLVVTNSAQSSAASTNSYDKEFVSNLQTVRYIDLDTRIFANLAYKALSFPQIPFEVDYNIPAGRRNPFLPIGSDPSISTTAKVEPENTAPATTSTSGTSTTTNRPRTTR